MKFKLKIREVRLHMGLLFFWQQWEQRFIDSLVRVERSYSYCGTGSVYSYDDAALCGKYSLSFR